MDVLNDNVNSNDVKWSTVVKRKKSKINSANSVIRHKIVGNNTSANLKTVPRFVDIHVYRLHPETTADALAGYLKPNFPEVICHQLVPKHEGQYSSFKVSVYQDNFHKVMSADKWPQGACVSKFFHPRRSGVQKTI